MNLRTFKKKLEIYGGDLARWDAGDANEARSLMVQFPEAQALFAETQELDRMLDSFQALPAPPGLSTHTANAALRQSRMARKEPRASLFWPSAGAAFAACLLLFASPQISVEKPSPQEAQAEINRFMAQLDRMANASEQEVSAADELLGLLAEVDGG